ncbi:DUF262 domain-containing protein [Luteibacter jiangsuensis]|uniref:DUF262 domain-containing protein n=1 Tax=Luteibacter jiangsuensis TaxID=637577 RepID=A0ABX0Q8C8_9GAMM|nr:DUF262 domain-containing protein [Luteibacter jiangsuensis]NID05877.1 DUF262 domain-containing protein [Luteibacter jiangsuensis]
MEANARHLERIFDHTVQYQIPLFQRPYVWEEEKNWKPLWEDIRRLLDLQVEGGSVHPHFLGAVVLEQVRTAAGSIETRQVIDGQQRFTTIQLFLAGCRDHAKRLGSEKFQDRFGDLIANHKNKIDHEDETYKVWPTNSDRPAYRLVQASGSLAELEQKLKSKPEMRASKIVGAYQYFYAQLADWLAPDAEEGEATDEASSQDRLEALWCVAKGCLQVVVIDLDKDDETQVIFETMNALGEPLLPADLIKNYLFRRASAEKLSEEDVEKLYDEHWAGFEAEPWRAEVKQGRNFRPLVDIFVNHFLSLVTMDEVRSTHLFSEFRRYVEDANRPTLNLLARPNSAAGHLEQLDRYAQIYLQFAQPKGHPRLATFLARLTAVDTTTVYPFLMFAYGHLMPDDQVEFDAVLEVLESFLMRRMVCGLTAKNYNRLFIDLVKAVDKSKAISAAQVATWLSKNSGDSMRFPSDEDFETAAVTRPLYNTLRQYKLRSVLEALEAYLQTSKSEAVPLPAGLTIEHVMPQEWKEHWPLSAEVMTDPGKAQEAASRRDVILNTLGNLTLVTGSLNPALSNAAWQDKRPELLKYSRLNLSRYFHDKEADVWNEQAIAKRSSELAMALLAIWPDVAKRFSPEAA